MLKRQKAAKKHSDRTDEPITSLLKLLARELILLESSDWQFLISTWAARDYAEMRFSNHYSDFKKILELLDKASSGEEFSNAEKELVRDISERDKVFEHIEPKWWAKMEYE